MLDSLVIYHSTSGQVADLKLDSDKWLFWSTCVRQMAIGFEEPIIQEAEIYVEGDAYRFFLEVVSGLHSPIVGETEVMGQFKELLEKTNRSDLKNRAQFLDFFKTVLKDAKNVRSNVLKDMGSRSYGSLLRKYVKENERVSFLGAGKLVKKVLPWLKPVKEITVKCRRLEQGQRLSEDFGVKIASLESRIFCDTLVIAAPMASGEISEILNGVTSLGKIIDLRESSSRDPLNMEIPTVTLAHLFREIISTEKDLEPKVAKARALIKELSLKWTLKAEHRPFGWEDLCG